jgi:hypothetical protein
MLPVMASRLRPLARHPIATIGWVTAAGWAVRNRHRLASFRMLAMSAPGRMRRGQRRDARLLEVVNGEAVIDGDPASPDYAALARLLTGRAGISVVRQRLAGDEAGPVEVRSDGTMNGDSDASPR